MKLRLMIFTVFVLIGGCMSARYNHYHNDVPMQKCKDVSIETSQTTEYFHDACYIEVFNGRFIPVSEVRDWVSFIQSLPSRSN